MIAKYKEMLFCVDTTVCPVDIWLFNAVPECDEFKKGVTRKGAVYYEKSVDISELDEVFDVGFSVKWNGDYFSCFPNFEDNTAYLRTDNKEEAERHGFLEEEYDRGMVILWYKVVSLDECEEFRFQKTVYTPEYFTELKINAKTTSEVVLSREEWADVHRKTVYELSPWNYYK